MQGLRLAGLVPVGQCASCFLGNITSSVFCTRTAQGLTFKALSANGADLSVVATTIGTLACMLYTGKNLTAHGME